MAKKKIELQKLTQNEAEQQGIELGKHIGEITEKVKQKIDKLLKAYDLEAEIQINFKKITKQEDLWQILTD